MQHVVLDLQIVICVSWVSLFEDKLIALDVPSLERTGQFSFKNELAQIRPNLEQVGSLFVGGTHLFAEPEQDWAKLVFSIVVARVVNFI